MTRIWSMGFTLVELMIVIAIIWMLWAYLYPQMSRYHSRGRDVVRISDIKDLSVIFQNYIHYNQIYPSNTNKDSITSYCISDIMLWDNAIATTTEKQYTFLGWTGALRKDPTSYNPWLSPCAIAWSYYYSRVDKETGYAILAARMENQTTGANWTGAIWMTQSGYIDAMQQTKPLDITQNDTDKIFLLITN